MRARVVVFVVLLFAVEAAGAEGPVERAKALLAELVAADTTNPPGNEARAVRIVARRLEEAGIPFTVSEFAPGRENLVARLEGGDGKPLLLLAHTDVVGAAGQPWTVEPNRLTERDGFLYGRGVFDDLGMAAVAVELLVSLRKEGVSLGRDVILALTGDEESGGGGITHLLEHDPESIAAGVALNEGGQVILGEDGRVKLVNLQVAEKIYQDFELSAEGPTGHSSVPQPGNAIYRLARALERIGSHDFPVRLLPVTRAYYAARAGVEEEPVAGAMRAVATAEDGLPADALATLLEDPVQAATLRTTCVATLVDAGTRENALPSRATANVNCRILPDDDLDPEEAIEATRKQLVSWIDDPEVAVERVGVFGAGPPSPLEGAAAEAIRRVLHDVWPDAPIVPSLSRGATDSRYLRAAGIPVYGLNPFPVTEADANRAHGIDERIPAASLGAGYDLLRRLVLELAAER